MTNLIKLLTTYLDINNALIRFIKHIHDLENVVNKVSKNAEDYAAIKSLLISISIYFVQCVFLLSLYGIITTEVFLYCFEHYFPEWWDYTENFLKNFFNNLLNYFNIFLNHGDNSQSSEILKTDAEILKTDVTEFFNVDSEKEGAFQNKQSDASLEKKEDAFYIPAVAFFVTWAVCMSIIVVYYN